MITVDGALWQKVRQPQQHYFHPDVYAEYVPYLLVSLNKKIEEWSKLAQSGATFEMLEETWGLAADMICRALFDREVPFNPHAVFGAVKAYTDASNHRSIRLKKVSGALTDVTEEEPPAHVVGAWLTLPEAVISAEPWQGREKTLLKMMQAAEASGLPAWDHRPGAGQDQAVPVGRHRDDGADARLDPLSRLAPSRGRRQDPPRGRRGLWHEEPDRGRHGAPFQYPLGHARGAAALPAGLGPHPHGSRRRRDRGPQDQGGRPHRAVPIRYPSRREILGGPGGVPTRALRAGQRRVKYSYLPFGAGKRFCLGGQLSQMEVALALTQLLRRFRPEYVGGTPPRVAASVTLMPKDGLPFRLHELS
jgi:cytochrome P450